MNHRLALTVLALGAASLTAAAPARADLTADLNGLTAQAGALRSVLADVNGPAGALCGPLVSVNQMSRGLVQQVTQVDSSLAAPLTVDASVLDALTALSVTTLDLANQAASLSVDLDAQKTAVNALSLKDGIVAVLQLSNDIGTMAERIGEMSDKILTMSDDIGIMADRILTTQEIQSQNLQLTESTLLQTQTNALALVSVVEDATYGVSFSGLIAQGNQLAATMRAVVLNPWTMAQKLSSVATAVQSFRGQVEGVRQTLLADTATSTLSTSATGLSQLFDMSVMLLGLSTAVDGYAIGISGLQAITSTPTLTSSLKSMLQLSADIGVMANRILEMAAQVPAMADNIGLEADQIVLTQQTVSGNVATTQASILAAQQLAVTLIAQRTH